MKLLTNHLRRLDWDTQFFGFPVALITTPVLDAAAVRTVLAEARRQGIKLAYWPADATTPAAPVAALGGRLVDRKTTFLVDVRRISCDPPSGPVVETCAPGEPVEGLYRLAVQSGQYSRFAVDPGIPREKCEQLFRLWIDRTLADPQSAIAVVRDGPSRIAGLVTMDVKDDRGSIGLIAVDAACRGRSLGYALVRYAQNWFRQKDLPEQQVVTQLDNQAACRLYRKCGYEIERVEHYYHFWL